MSESVIPPKGTKVHVEYDGVLERHNIHPGSNLVTRDAGGSIHYYRPEDITITPLPPENWPPEIGDVWRAGEKEFYVRSYYGRPGHIVVTTFDTDDDREFSNVVGVYQPLEAFKALSPVLRYRPEPSPES